MLVPEFVEHQRKRLPNGRRTVAIGSEGSVQIEDIIGEVKRHSYYLKPGAKRRAKQALARKRARKKKRREPD
jgi:hypothetical protein